MQGFALNNRSHLEEKAKAKVNHVYQCRGLARDSGTRVAAFDLVSSEAYLLPFTVECRPNHWLNRCSSSCCLQDGTLALQKSTLQVPKDADDWVLYNKSVPAKLKELEDQGFKIVIFRSSFYSAQHWMS